MAEPTYRTTDGTKWGVGKGSNLTPTEVDLNFWAVVERIVDLENNPPSAVGIDYFSISGDQLTVHMTDHSTLGPYTIPSSTWNFTGQFQAPRDYKIFDVLRQNGNLYLVIYAHTSSSPFDANANDGMGNDYYALILESPTAGQWRGEWTAATGYLQGDTFKYTADGDPDSGMYNVLRDHDSPAIFDPDHTDGASPGDPVYQLAIPIDRSYDMALFAAAPFGAAEKVWEHIAVRSFTLPDDFVGSLAKLTSNNSGTAIFNLHLNGSEIATITFTNSTTGVFTSSSDQSIVVGDILTLYAPYPSDASLTDLKLTIIGRR